MLVIDNTDADMKEYLSDKLVRAYVARTNKNMEKNHQTLEMHTLDGIESNLNVPYTSRDGAQLYMDVYKPAFKPGVKYPVIIYVHGGGLIFGDRTMVNGFGQMLAARGYIVCAIEFRLVPSVRAYEDMADASAGYDFAVQYLSEMPDADVSKVYIASESAGSYLAVYINAMAHSKAFETAVGYKAANMNVRAMALVGGMYYTGRKDKIGVLKTSYYGKGPKAKAFKPYINPEHKDIISSLPPSLLITSKADFLKKYSKKYSKALQKNNIEYKLYDFGRDKRLTHAFPLIHPDYPESTVAAEIIDDWFKTH